MENQGKLYFELFLTSNTLLMAIYLLSGFLLLAIIISMMRIYKKAGKPAVSVIVPFWGQIVLFQIVELPWWYIFIPIFNIIMMIKAYVLLAKKFGKGVWFAIGMLFLPMIFIPLLSFYDYIGNKPKEVNDGLIYNPFNQTNVEQVVAETPAVPTVLTNAEVSEEVVPNLVENQVSVPVEPVEPLESLPGVSNENVNGVNEPIVNAPVMEVTDVVEAPVVSEGAEIPVVSEIIEVPNVPEVQSVDNNTAANNFETVGTVIPEVQAETINDLGIEQNFVESINQNVGVQEIAPVTGVQNPTVHDIRDALNINENSNVQEILETDESLESSNNIVEGQEDVIEMPEIAAKNCPACGVSLSGDIKFCTSCGTKIY